MPTILSHPAVALALAPCFRGTLPDRRWIGVGALLSVLPDADTIGFRFGIAYGDLLGHRGLTHSLAFAVLVALACAALARERRGALCLYLFLCTASHGLLDAFTNGGLGVAFLAPFDDTRYFFPWRPIAVSPIGVHNFLNGRALAVLRSELLWVWAPSLLLYFAGRALRSRTPGEAEPGV
jgi:inner membrane protein